MPANEPEVVYAAVFVSAALRIAAAQIGLQALLDGCGPLWIAGFGLFALSDGPMLLRKKPQETPARC